MGTHIRVALLTVPVADGEVAADALWAAGAAAVEERPGPAPGTCTLVADVGPAALRAGWTLEHREVDDGRDAWRAHARAWTAGPFTVRPPWLAPPTDGSVDLVVDPGHAFGSGSHPTTRLALDELAALVAPGVAVLDIGCGSGVLALAAALLGARPVDAVDVDPAAREATAANAARNGVVVTLAELDDLRGPYAVVLANIGAATLRALAPAIEARAAPGASIVLSGVLADQADEVVRAFAAPEVARRHDDGWVALVLRTAAQPLT